MSFQDSLNFVLKWEGLWSDDPRDPGGATMKGVTLATYKNYRASKGLSEPTKDDLRNISDAELGEIYKTSYWDSFSGDKIPEDLAFLMFDAAVNMGQKRAAMLAQDALGITVDGNFGPVSIKTANSKGSTRQVLVDFTSKRILYYSSRPNFPVYGLGWVRRSCDSLASVSSYVAQR